MRAPGSPPPADALLVFAKAPQVGRVKTRLCPPMEPVDAAAFYAAMLEDVLDASAAFAKELGLAAVLCLDSPEGPEALPFPVPEPFVVEAQRGSGLAARMESALEAAFARGARRVLVRGSDSPTLSRAHLEEALQGLRTHDFVFSPDQGGGYGLVGCSRSRPGLLDLPMSTETVFRDTLDRARAWGVGVQSLQPCFDLDRWADLEALRGAREGPLGLLCPRTLAFLDAGSWWFRA